MSITRTHSRHRLAAVAHNGRNRNAKDKILSLELESISVAFGGFKALDDVTISLKKAEIVGLIGPNGAGKTTCVNIITGFQDPTSGTVMLDGQDINAKAPYDIRRRGLARTFQAGRLFSGLDVLDNLAVTGVGLGHSRRASEDEALRVLSWMGAGHLAELPAAGLPYTDERRVGIARALMFAVFLRERFVLRFFFFRQLSIPRRDDRKRQPSGFDHRGGELHLSGRFRQRQHQYA